MSSDWPGPQPYSEFFGRLRARPLSSWQINGRAAAARAAIDALAALGRRPGDLAGRGPVVPDLGAHALADQLQVLTDDADAAGVGDAAIEKVLEQLAERLSVRLR